MPMRFAPRPENDFADYIRTYYRECRARFDGIEAIAGKWMFRDLIPGMSDFDTRFIVRDGMTADDWCRMSTAVGEAHLRLGYEKERYVFNPSGQELDLTGLIVVADSYGGASRAMGSPIKDSQFAKLSDETTSALAVVYANPRLVNELHMEQILSEWADLARKFAGAHSAQTRVIAAE